MWRWCCMQNTVVVTTPHLPTMLLLLLEPIPILLRQLPLHRLKGPRHGGANLKVQQMFADIKEHCPDYEDEKTLTRYLEDMLDKKVFDKSGLIYGMGHAVYTLSDPREVILKEYAKRLSEEKGTAAGIWAL